VAAGVSTTPRARAGVIVPSVNTVVDDDVRRFVDPALGVHVARWRTAKAHDASAAAMVTLPDVARALADVEPDVVAFACTAGSAVGGRDTERDVVAALGDVLQVPVVTTAGSLARDVGQLGAQRVMFCCPFDEDYMAPEVDGFRQLGVPVTRTQAWGLSSPAQCRGMSPAEICARVLLDVDDSTDLVLISCANVRAMECVADLQGRLHRPVLTSNCSVLAAAAQLVGLDQALPVGLRPPQPALGARP
jgi:maleate isomerase